MIGFGLILAAPDYVPGLPQPAWLALRAAVPAALAGYFFFRGQYPELARFRPGVGAGLDIVVGLAVTALWMAPYLIWPALRPDAAEAFDPEAVGATQRGLMLALRFAGFALVTPIVEELLVRSYLIRMAEVWDSDKSFRDVEIGLFAWRGFVFTLLWFTFTHAQWEWPVAAAACLVYNLWLYQRKHIGSLVLAHAATNASLFAAVLWGAAQGRDWWFFL